jgi:deoxyribonuclease V
MKIPALHRWNLEPEEARRLQKELASRVVRRDTFTRVTTVCGLDVGIRGDRATASCVVMRFPELEIIEERVESSSLTFPYIPGLLSFREIPALVPALESVRREPDLILVDGQGIAHPRRLGLAAHLGILLDRPVIGCAKSRLTGRYEELGVERGDWAYLRDGDEVIGAVLRTRRNVRPLFVSIGYGIALHSAVHYVLKCCTRYRITEPVRRAHRLAGERVDG